MLHYFPPLVAGIIIPTLVVIALIVIPYFNINVQGEPMWAGERWRRFRVLLVTLGVAVVVLGWFEAWTMLAPTVVIGGLLVYSYFQPPGRNPAGEFLRTRSISWWVMTWFIAVAVVLTVVGTFFRGPGWSWVWPWKPHGA
jgi:hypothetical protein